MIALSPVSPLKILLAVDGSQHSIAAVNLLTCIMWPAATSVQVLAMVPERLPIMDPDPETQVMVDEALELARWRDWAAAKILTTEVAAQLRDHDLAAKTEICEGRPVDVILKYSENQPTNLIVVGAKSFSPPDDFRLGPTAHKLTHYADYSVLVARSSTQVRPLNTILVVDGSPEAQLAVDFLCALSLPQWARVTVVTVVEEKEGAMAGMSLAYRYPSAGLPQTVLDAAETYEARVIERLHNCGAQVRSITCFGTPVDKILSIAREQEANLIVLGARSQPLTESFRWDGMAQKVVKYASCSVLAVRRKLETIDVDDSQAAGTDCDFEHLLTTPPSGFAELMLQK